MTDMNKNSFAEDASGNCCLKVEFKTAGVNRIPLDENSKRKSRVQCEAEKDQNTTGNNSVKVVVTS